MRPPAFLRFAKISKIHYIYTIKNKKVPRITAKNFVHKRYFTVNYSFRASFHCIPALQSESSGQFSEKPLLSLFLCKNIVGILHCNNIDVTFTPFVKSIVRVVGVEICPAVHPSVTGTECSHIVHRSNAIEQCIAKRCCANKLASCLWHIGGTCTCCIGEKQL